MSASARPSREHVFSVDGCEGEQGLLQPVCGDERGFAEGC